MEQRQTKLPAPELEYWREQVSEVVLEPDLWLRLPHEALGGREPLEMLCSGRERDTQLVQDLLDSIKYGMFT